MRRKRIKKKGKKIELIKKKREKRRKQSNVRYN